jgi:hypothetical protein
MSKHMVYKSIKFQKLFFHSSNSVLSFTSTSTTVILPKVRGELKKHVHSYVIKYKEDTDQLTDDELKASVGLSLLTDDTISFIHETCSQIQVKSQLRNPDKLITERKEEAVYWKKRERALQQASFNTDYYNIPTFAQ